MCIIFDLNSLPIEGETLANSLSILPWFYWKLTFVLKAELVNYSIICINIYRSYCKINQKL
jgi:hypothetical protein